MAELDTEARERLAKAGKAMPGGRFPIRDKSDLGNAIQAVGRASGGEAGRKRVRRWIYRRAKELNALGMIPATWMPDGSIHGS